ncbi:hypothetical protein I0C86_15300 [Plantactinospora sp. S1510]|uniref:Uncharacterized protein n=1 Tax=Plantactinospora alkalitolerans TaxID=2789879 RepID=A0ABS0GVT4_9ACTN|nr:hypothetical protein [Plantactinospora alkalitolerans]MBF9130311.1 hypothetical protein [Plantactinospora alkalitolerans]
MTRYYTEADLVRAVQRQVAIDRTYRANYQRAVATQNQAWLYELVKTAVRLVFGVVVGDFLTVGVEIVWEFFADLFSD